MAEPISEIPVFSPGRIVKFIKNGASLTGNIYGISNQELTLSFRNNYEGLVSTGIPKTVAMATNFLGGILGEISLDAPNSLQHKSMGLKIWTSTEPMSFNLNLNFFMGSYGYYSGFREVYWPMMKILGASLPSESTGGFLKGPGPNIIEQVKGIFDENVTLSVQIGEMFLIRNIIIEDPQVTFSQELDEQGFPINGTLDLGISTVNIATIQLINTMGTKLTLSEEQNKEVLEIDTATASELSNAILRFDSKQYNQIIDDKKEEQNIKSKQVEIVVTPTGGLTSQWEAYII